MSSVKNTLLKLRYYLDFSYVADLRFGVDSLWGLHVCFIKCWSRLWFWKLHFSFAMSVQRQGVPHADRYEELLIICSPVFSQGNGLNEIRCYFRQTCYSGIRGNLWVKRCWVLLNGDPLISGQLIDFLYFFFFSFFFLVSSPLCNFLTALWKSKERNYIFMRKLFLSTWCKQMGKLQGSPLPVFFH